MSSGRVCAHCGCSEIDIDQARGDAVCTGCGSVLEDQIIVSEVQFQESAGGSSSVIGQFVSSEGIKSHTLGSSFQQGFNRESRAITLQNAKKKIQYVGAQLRLNQHCIDTAFNFFKMAVNKRLTRGRKTMHVVAACVYLVCRTEGTPHMLLDLSDILQVNVYSLGKTYLQLSRELCINVPAIDPCLYIPRFAHKLEFDEKSHEVSMTAMRLVQRMKRDWIHTGRRPSGLCGAALLVAARIHDFCRTLKDIIKVVRVCETTIRKRLNEFSNTASSQLTIDEFQRIDLEEEADPPAFTASKMKAKLAQMEENNQLKDLTSEVSCLQEEIEKTLEKTQKKPRGPWAAYANAASVSLSSEKVTNTPPWSQEPRVPEVLSETLTLTDNSVSPNMDVLTPPSSQTPSVVASRPDTPGDERDPEVSKLEERELTEVISAVPVEVVNPGPTAASIGIKDVIADCMKDDDHQETTEEDGELDLTGIDDAELDRWILGEEEVKVKTELWMIANADYLQEQKEKEEREAKEKEENANKPEKKPKRKNKKRQPIQANTAKEAIEQMLHQKRISAKINYDVLKDLNKSDTSSPNAVKIPESPLPQRTRKPPVNVMNVDTSVMFSTLSRFRKSSISRDGPLESKEILEEPVEKKARLDEEPTEVVEECGPVQYGDQAEEEEEEDYEGEDELVSAAQLLGHTGYVDEEPEYYDTYDMD